MLKAQALSSKRISALLGALLALWLLAPASLWAGQTGQWAVGSGQWAAAQLDKALSYTPNEVLVKLADSAAIAGQNGVLQAANPALSKALSRFGLTDATRIAPGTYKLSGSSLDVMAAVQALKATGAVSYAGPNHLYHTMLTPNDEQYAAGQQWGVTQIKSEQAWDVTTGSENIVIAILDTGTASGHPDLSGKVIPGYDFANNDDNPEDDNGHGTYTAGIAAANSNNGTGVVGISWGARIMPVKVLHGEGYGSEEAIARGIRWAVDNGARIISASLGGDEDTPVLKDAAQYAYDRNVLLVASSGNTPDGKPNYPAGYDTVLAVGATGRADTYTGFSSWGRYVDVTAPGVGILSTGWDNGNLDYEYGNGTSASCPFVSGVAALVWSANPSLTAAQVKQIIEDSSDDLGDPGWDEHYGQGRLNAFRAVQMAQQGPPPTRTATIVAEPTNTPAPTSTRAPAPNLQINITTVSPGALVSIVGGGFGSNEIVDLQLTTPDGGVNGIGNTQTGPQGDFRAEVALPQNLPSGKVTLAAVGAQSKLRASVELTVIGGSGNGGQSKVQGVIKGGNPVNALVSLKPNSLLAAQELTTPTGQDGAFSFSGLTAGIYSVSASAPGFLPTGPYVVQVDGTAADLKVLSITLSATRPQAFERMPAVNNTPNLAYFPPVGHTLKGPFLKFWQTRGGLAIFGYPISEEFEEVSATDGRVYVVQYFERNRFEYHPEFAGTPSEVLMGLLGVDTTRGRTFLPGAPFQSDGLHAYFNETRHSLSGPFLKYWQKYGGLAVFGYPISEEIMENGYLVQYFERNRFEYHPEFAGTPNEVLLGLLGVETVRRSGWLTP